jgi:hypothetical protein
MPTKRHTAENATHKTHTKTTVQTTKYRYIACHASSSDIPQMGIIFWSRWLVVRLFVACYKVFFGNIYQQLHLTCICLQLLSWRAQ